MTQTDLDLSVIIQPGSNTRHLHKLILNIKDSLHSTPYRYELILSDSEYVSRYLGEYGNHDISIRLVPKDELLSDPLGRVVAIFEENSLVSSNWIPEAIKAIEADASAAYYTETTIFSTKQYGQYIWSKQNSTHPHTVTSLIIKSQWDFPIILNRNLISPSLLDSLWAFTEDILASGGHNLVIPKSACFKRHTPYQDALSPVTYSKLYSKLSDPPSSKDGKKTDFSNLAPRSQFHFNVNLKENLRRLHVWMKRRSRLYVAFAMPLLRSYDSRSTSKKIPDWAIQAWKDVHRFDRTVFPTRDEIRALTPYTSSSIDSGVAVQKMLLAIEKNPDYIFLSQHMMKGGGDKVVLNYIKAAQKSKPNWKLLLIVTEEFNNTWSDKVPDSVDYIDFGNIAKDFDTTTRYIMLMRLIVQLKAKRMMFAMTPFGFEVIEQYSDFFIKNNYQLDTVAFCSDTDQFGRTWGIHFFGIPDTFPALHKIATDNQRVIDETVELEPLSRDKFTVHYQPVDYNFVSPKLRDSGKTPVRILWASRIANQKRPDIIIDIAKKVDSTKYTIDMFGNIEDEYSTKDFLGLDALEYKGGFNGLNSLPISEYDIFIYTSAFDGVPNILLEAAALGLPIIAPRVGGIGEFIKHNKTGLLIEDVDDVNAYCDAIAYLSDNPKKAQSMVRAAQELLTYQHSEKNFQAIAHRELFF